MSPLLVLVRSHSFDLVLGVWGYCLGEGGKGGREVHGRGGNPSPFPSYCNFASVHYIRGKLLVVVSISWLVTFLSSIVHPHLPGVIVCVFRVPLLESFIPVRVT